MDLCVSSGGGGERGGGMKKCWLSRTWGWKSHIADAKGNESRLSLK